MMSIFSSLGRRFRGLALGALGLALTSGCIVFRDDGVDPAPPAPGASIPGDTGSMTPAEVLTVNIDTGATLAAAPGEGVGVFVEYRAGGHWNVWTTSDVNVGGVPRSFDILATAIDDTAVLSNVTGVDLGAEDRASLTAVNQVQLLTETDIGADGITFDSTPGAVIELDVLVDGASDSRIIYWVGDDILHEGAPTNPIDFWPSAP
jgi:hypothetical protein